MALPTAQVLLDDGTGTFPYDITTRCRLTEGLTGGRGRGDELSQAAAQQITLVIDNTDGAFTMGSTIIASPSPIKLDAQIRVKLTANATTVNRYTGNLIAAPASWPSGGDEFTLVKATLIDPQAQFDRRPLRSWVEETWLPNLPLALYLFNEPADATSCADFSGNNAPAFTPQGVGAAVVLGTATGAPTDGYTAAQFSGGQSLGITNGYDFFGGFTKRCFEGVFTRSGVVATTEGIFIDPAYATPSYLAVMDTTGRIVVGSFTSAAAYNDGLPHHLFISYNGTAATVYIDGVNLGAGSGVLNVGIPVMTGSLSCFAISNGPEVPATVAAHATAALTGFAGESGTARITRVAGYVGLPIGTLDTSLTNVAFTPIEGKSAAGLANEVAEAEFGIVYFNGSGALDFHNRNRGPLKTTPDITVDANFLAEGTEIQWDMQGVVNYLEVTAAGTSVTQLARNKTSEITNKHGRYPGDAKTYLVQTDAEALDRGNWIVNTKGEPLPRAGSLVVDLMTMTPAQQAAWLLCEPDHWIQVTGLPATTHGGTTLDVVVEGWAESMNKDEWTLTLNVVSRSFFTAWVLGDTTLSVLGSTTKLYI